MPAFFVFRGCLFQGFADDVARICRLLHYFLVRKSPFLQIILDGNSQQFRYENKE